MWQTSGISGKQRGRRRSAERDVQTDVDDLVGIWGEQAYDVAAGMSWRADIGLLPVSDPDHLMRVTLELGRRLDIAAAPPLKNARSSDRMFDLRAPRGSLVAALKVMAARVGIANPCETRAIHRVAAQS